MIRAKYFKKISIPLDVHALYSLNICLVRILLQLVLFDNYPRLYTSYHINKSLKVVFI